MSKKSQPGPQYPLLQRIFQSASPKTKTGKRSIETKSRQLVEGRSCHPCPPPPHIVCRNDGEINFFFSKPHPDSIHRETRRSENSPSKSKHEKKALPCDSGRSSTRQWARDRRMGSFFSCPLSTFPLQLPTAAARPHGSHQFQNQQHTETPDLCPMIRGRMAWLV